MLCAYTAFLAVADEQFGRQVPFAFLEKVKAEFLEKFAQTGRAAPAHSMDRTVGCAVRALCNQRSELVSGAQKSHPAVRTNRPRLKHWMAYCSQHPQEMSKVASVQQKVRAQGRVLRRVSRCAVAQGRCLGLCRWTR